MKKIIIISLMLFLTSPVYAWQSKSVKKANDFISAGMTNDAIQTLETGIKEKPKDVDAHWMLGKLYLKRGSYSSAEQRFNSAVLLKPSLKSQLGGLYKGVADSALTKGNIKQALSFYDKVVQYDSSLRNSISKSKSDYIGNLSAIATSQLKQKNIKDAKQTHKQILALMPGERNSLYQSMIAIGNDMSDKDCFSVYQYALTLCSPCPKNQEVGKRLEKIADAIESKDLFDNRVEGYLGLASKYADGIRAYKKTYYPRQEVYKFELSKGKYTEWINFPEGIDVKYSISGTNENYEILYKDRIIIHPYKNERIPDKTSADFILKGISKNEITTIYMYVNTSK